MTAPYSVWQGTIQDGNGVAQPGASIEVRLESTGALATIYSDKNGAAETNPFTADSEGYAVFYADQGAYQITATSGSFSATHRNVPIGTAQQKDAGEKIDFEQVETYNSGGIVITEQLEMKSAAETSFQGAFKYLQIVGSTFKNALFGNVNDVNDPAAGNILTALGVLDYDETAPAGLLNSANYRALHTASYNPSVDFSQFQSLINGSTVFLSEKSGTATSSTSIADPDNVGAITISGITADITIDVDSSGELKSSIQTSAMNSGAPSDLALATKKYVDDAAGGAIGGSTGSTDNALLLANGTGGSTVQSSNNLTFDEASNLFEFTPDSFNAQAKINFANNGSNTFYISADNAGQATTSGIRFLINNSNISSWEPIRLSHSGANGNVNIFGQGGSGSLNLYSDLTNLSGNFIKLTRSNNKITIDANDIDIDCGTGDLDLTASGGGADINMVAGGEVTTDKALTLKFTTQSSSVTAGVGDLLDVDTNGLTITLPDAGETGDQIYVCSSSSTGCTIAAAGSATTSVTALADGEIAKMTLVIDSGGTRKWKGTAV